MAITAAPLATPLLLMYSCKERRGKKSQKEKVVLICMQAFIRICEYAKDRSWRFACVGDEWPACLRMGRDGTPSPSSAYPYLIYLFIYLFLHLLWSAPFPSGVSHPQWTLAAFDLHPQTRTGFSEIRSIQ